jgi:hypothetical protein
MANVISVTAVATPSEGKLAANAARVINVKNILGIKAATNAAFPTAVTAITYAYNEDNALKSGDFWVTETAAALVTASNA